MSDATPAIIPIRWPAEDIWQAVVPSLQGFTVEILPSSDSSNSELMRRFRGNPLGAKPIFGVGAAGNAWITSAVYAALVGHLDWGLDPQRALELPRFLPGGRNAFGPPGATTTFTIEYEDGFAPSVIRALEAKGWEMLPISLRGELRMGYGAAVSIDGRTATAGADPRRAGAAGAVP